MICSVLYELPIVNIDIKINLLVRQVLKAFLHSCKALLMTLKHVNRLIYLKFNVKQIK